jgi:hypothetical protein
MAQGTVVQQPERLRVHPTGRRDEGRLCSHQSGRTRWLAGLNEGQKVTFELVADRRTGKSSAENLRAL